MHPSFKTLDHRPFPHPKKIAWWRQSWCDLLFAHWPIAAKELRPLVPPELEIQEFDGTSWIGVVPFRMAGVQRRPLPDFPWLSAFPELNLRIYVEKDGVAGVWFLSLDATNPIAVWAASNMFHLPYYRAQIEIAKENGRIHYRSQRAQDPGLGVKFEAEYGPTSEPYYSQPGTLEHFLTERYCLYTTHRKGHLLRCDVHHAPWPLQSATAEIQVNELLDPHGISVTGSPPLLHFCRRIDTVVWSPVRVS